MPAMFRRWWQGCDASDDAPVSNLATLSLRPFGLPLWLVLAIVLGPVGCVPSPKPERPRLVLLYATCSLNRLFLSPYDDTRSFTPNLDNFAKEGLVFEKHMTESGRSGNAYAALYSGRQAPGHGIYEHPARLGASVELISERFAEAGFETSSWLNHMMATAKLGYAQGVPPARQHEPLLKGDDRDFQMLLDRLAADPAKHAFVTTNFSVTHGPYFALKLGEFCDRYPAECAIRSHPDFDRLRSTYFKDPIAFNWDFGNTAKRLKLRPKDYEPLNRVVELLYKAGVYHLDQLFGGVIAAIEQRGLLDQSLVTFTSDHGEILVRDNAPFRWTHGMQLAPEVLNVAFILRGPEVGVPRGRYKGVTRSIDVFPTLASLSGLEPPTGNGFGHDLKMAVRGEVEPPDLVAFSHTALMATEFRKKLLGTLPVLQQRFPRQDPALMWVAARKGDDFFELRRDPETGVFSTYRYNLVNDPEKRRDQFDTGKPSDQAVRGLLEHYKVELDAGYSRKQHGVASVPKEDVIRRLKSLGYIN